MLNRVFLLILVSASLSVSTQSFAQTSVLKVTPPSNQLESLVGQQILHALLLDMGLALPKKIKQAPQPTPSPTPTPPAPAKSDDIFGDDDFFDDDKSFEDIVKSMDEEYENTVKAWDEEFERTLAKWNKAKVVFNKNKATYKRVVENYPASDSAAPKGMIESTNDARATKNLNTMQAGEFHTVPGALNLPIRNQANRGTCSAFASVRAMESVLSQYKIFSDLSEQHFYWTSKPHCKSAACKTPGEPEGVNTGGALDNARRASAPYIFLEDQCPYSPIVQRQNVTYAPLSQCQKYGKPAVKPTLNGIGNVPKQKLHLALLNNMPIVASLKLTNQWWEDRGFIFHEEDANDPPSTNKHAGGHAVTFVGLIKLPQKLKHEGRYCAIVANSWGTGWGRGGHACLSERWIQQNGNYFVAVNSVAVTNHVLRTYDVSEL